MDENVAGFYRGFGFSLFCGGFQKILVGIIQREEQDLLNLEYFSG